MVCNHGDHPIQESLLEVIAEKKKALTLRRKSKGANKGTRDQPSSNVINIMDALRKSMEAELRGREQTKR